jgi:hypothetical protein
MTSSNPRLDPALQVLEDAGHTVGSAGLVDGEMLIAIDNVLRTFEEVFQMADDEGRKPKPGPLTGEYVRLILAPSTRMGTLGDAIVEHGHLQYLFQPDGRFRVLPVPAFYIYEGDFETCERPTDAAVEAINKIAEYGS